MERSKIKGVKTEMKERKLNNFVNCQGALERRGCKINWRKTRTGCNCYSTI